MISNSFTIGLGIYVEILLIIFLAIYIYFFYKTIKEGKDRDLGIFLLVVFALLGSPFLAYGFVLATKQDSDRILVKVKTDDEVLNEMSLSELIAAKTAKENIVELTDITALCRFCRNHLENYETQCSKCGKKRVWYYLLAEHDKPRTKVLVTLNRWHEIPDGFKIKRVRRKNSLV